MSATGMSFFYRIPARSAEERLIMLMVGDCCDGLTRETEVSIEWLAEVCCMPEENVEPALRRLESTGAFRVYVHEYSAQKGETPVIIVANYKWRTE